MAQTIRKTQWATWLIIALVAMPFLGACQRAETQPDAEPAAESPAAESPAAGSPAVESSPTAVAARPMMGPGSGMMARHHATIPDDYSGLQNPTPAGQESVARGAEIYQTNCVTCHGEEGLGDGPGSAGLDPAPAPLAHTARMLADDYLFWRISEGGVIAPFNSAMPSWKAALDEEARWDVINYLRVLSGGQPQPGPADVRAEAEQRAAMLAAAVEDGLITEQEAELFDDVHKEMDALLAEQPMGPGRMMGAGQDDVLAELVADGAFTEQQIQAFNDIHDRLLMAGLMGG
jgi:mono/diheme cytochrome c family protein